VAELPFMLMHPKPPDENEGRDSTDRGSSNPGEGKTADGGAQNAQNGETGSAAAGATPSKDLMASEPNLIQL
jgi:hypothetical protein